MGNVFPTHREVSAQEAVYRFLSMPMKKCSRQVVFINTSLPSERIHILKCRHQLQQLDPDNDDVYQKGLLDRYAARPKSLDNMFLADFGSLYQSNYGNAKEVENLSEDNYCHKEHATCGDWVTICLAKFATIVKQIPNTE